MPCFYKTALCKLSFWNAKPITLIICLLSGDMKVYIKLMKWITSVTQCLLTGRAPSFHIMYISNFNCIRLS